MPLDPQLEPAGGVGLVGSIRLAAQPELRRRSAVPYPLLLISDWFRPTLAASATVAACALSIVLLLGETTPAEENVRIVAEGIGLPSAIASWLDTGEADVLDELVLGFEGEAP